MAVRGLDQLMHLQLRFPSASFASLIQAASISCNTFRSSTVLADLTNRRHSSANLQYCADGSILKKPFAPMRCSRKIHPHRNLLPESLTANYRIAADRRCRHDHSTNRRVRERCEVFHLVGGSVARRSDPSAPRFTSLAARVCAMKGTRARGQTV